MQTRVNYACCSPYSSLLASAWDASSSSGCGSWQADEEEAEVELALVTLVAATAYPRYERERKGRTAEALERADALHEQLDERRRVDADRHVRVRLPAAAAPDVDDGAAAAELRLAVHLDVQLARLE